MVLILEVDVVTRVIWQSRTGRRMKHSMGFQCTLSYARDWFRRSIEECQGILSLDERRSSQLKLIEVQNVSETVSED